MDEQERRSRLLGLKDTVRAFFEVTNVTAGGRGWSSAFQAVRQNDYMADSFLVELRALIDFIEVEFDPLFGRRGGDGKSQITDELPARETHTPSVASVSQALAAARKEVLSGRTPVVARVVEKPAPAPRTPPAPPKAPSRPVPHDAKTGPVARPSPVAAKAPPAPPRPSPILERAASKRPVAPPPPPPRRNQFADSETRIDSSPRFSMEDETDATGRMIMPPMHEPPSPKKKR